ncbi:MAG: hypothetical protein HYR63_05945 [Proteobacteria bacterium]|nr:hypothetical protein [Pseudomonadota bacterium]MBI3497392.1 hypothetical protein [Pseudomonadota bacterium]
MQPRHGDVALDYRRYRVNAQDRQPLLDFMLGALQDAGCRVLRCTPPNEAPFRIGFETPDGERIGVIAYAFLATRTPTKNRPLDERSFQIKYGSKGDGTPHDVWQDPFGIYTTLFFGIDPKERFFVAVDPEMHNPTKMFIRFEFKDSHVELIKRNGWHVWERQKRSDGLEEPIEVVVGGSAANFLRFVQFERAAKGLDQGHRQLLADKTELLKRPAAGVADIEPAIDTVALHPLVRELAMNPHQILEIIASARRLKMAVRGWVAEEHLKTAIEKAPGITDCQRLDVEGGPDIRLRYKDGRPILIECKNVLRQTNAKKQPRVDFQRTRASKSDPCSRYYGAGEFDVLAACLHAVTERWEFKYKLPIELPGHKQCPGKLASNVTVDEMWDASIVPILERLSA